MGRDEIAGRGLVEAEESNDGRSATGITIPIKEGVAEAVVDT